MKKKGMNRSGSPTYFLGGKYNALFSETRPILEHSNIVLMASLYS